VHEDSDLVIKAGGLMLAVNGADVHLLEVAHNHHLPLALVL